MVKFIKQNKVVVLLNGRYAGKKAVVRPIPRHSLSAIQHNSELLIAERFIYGITNIHGSRSVFPLWANIRILSFNLY
ncbi:hypothetical protein BGZ67_007834 [Mortierella alpina]|nr:hypothetical protein BGZ67_007834 [Mortierella alpina]